MTKFPPSDSGSLKGALTHIRPPSKGKFGPRIDPEHVDNGGVIDPAPDADHQGPSPLIQSLGLWDDDQPNTAPEPEDDDFGSKMIKTVKLADKLFTVMKKKGLREARAKCPDCPGHLQGRYYGPRAARFWCDGTCGKKMTA